QICLLCGGVALIRDQIAAAEINRSVVAGKRLLPSPTTPEQLDHIHDERMRLEARLINRPDDPEGLRMLSRLVTADYRWQVMLLDSGESVRDQPGFDAAFQKFTVFGLAAVARQNDVATEYMRSQLAPMLDDSGLPRILKNLQRQFPLMPNIALARAQVSAILSDDTMLAQQASRAMFVEPSNAETLCQLGSLAVRCGQFELAEKLWKRSIQVSVEFQPVVLLDAQLHWSKTDAMQLFGPHNYVRCVRAAQKSRDGTLTAELYDRAEQLWPEQLLNRTEEADLLRAMHLKATERRDDAISWSQECVLLPGARIPHRRYLAGLLEEAGQYMDALQEWHAVRSLEFGDAQADAAIARLNAME
ncbi:MAG: hypothetical protein GY903_00020, partial [Fuerstiella sp.]|nr:hypothetical protein [Fuerstiella sp.]